MRSGTQSSQEGSPRKSAKTTEAAPPGPRSRFQAAPKGGLILGDRDEELLETVFLWQALTRGQLQELFFGSVQRCNLRLRQLFDWEYLRRYYPPQAVYGAQAVYTLGPAGIPVVARRLEADEADIRQQVRGRTPTFLEHTLATVDFWLSVRRASAAGADVALDLALAETQCRHEYEIRPKDNGPWRMEVFKPDAFLRIQRERALRSYFVEMDLGHTSSGQFAEKLRHHERYLESGLFSESYGPGDFKTLVVTTSEVRARNLLAIAEQRKSDLFWFAVSAQVAAGPLEPIWRVPFHDNPVAL